MKFLALALTALCGIAQAQTVVHIGPGAAPGGAIDIASYGGANIPNDGGINLGFSFGPVVTAALINGVAFTSSYQPPLTTSGAIAIRTYDATLTSASGQTARLQLVTWTHAARCNVRIASGCAYNRIEPGATITIN